MQTKKQKIRKFLFYHAVALFIVGLFVLITAYNYSNESNQAQLSPPWPEQATEASSFSQKAVVGGIAFFIILFIAFVTIILHFLSNDN